MAIAFVQVGFANPQTTQISVPVTFTNPQGAGNLNVIAIGWNDATSTISSVTDTNGNTYTLCNAIARATTISQAMYYAKNITGGSNTVTVVFNATTTFIDIRALEYSGIDTTNPLDQVAVGTGNNSAATPTTANTGTTSVANEVLVAGGYANHSYTAAGAGYTSRIITPLNAKIAEDEIVAATGIYNATATIGQSSNWIIQLATFKAAASGKIVAALNGRASASLLNLSKGFIASNTSLSFTDNFNTGSLNPRWVIDTGTAPGTIAGINTGTFSAAFVDMTQNVLALKVTQTGSAPVISTGAEVRSINTFGFGSYEWSMRASSTATTPGGTGSVTSGQISSGFTFINNSQTEIDSPEIEGQSPKAIEWTNFSGVANKQTSTTNVAFSPDQGFHTYKFIWQPTQIDFYIDGIHVDFHNTNIPITPAFILFNHWGTNSTGFGGLATTGVTRWLYFNKFSFVPLAAIGSSVVAAVLRGAVFQSALVSWNASSGATSYNVKRANALAGPYSNRGTVAGTTFTDYDLFLQGNTYYYEVTAVNAAGESGPSTIVPVSIPISSTLAANFAGNCFVNAVSKALGKIVSPIIGDANVNATVIAKGKIVSSIIGTSVVTAIAKSPGGIISHIFGTSSVSGTVKATGKVVSVMSGHGSVTAAIVSKGIILSAITGHATFSGTGRRLGVLKSNILGTSSVQASTFVGAMVSNIFGVGTVNATIKAAPHTILANITGTGSVVSTIKGLGKIVSSTTGHGIVNSAIIAKGLIASSITGHGSVTGTFHITGGIISHILGTSAITAQVNAKGIIVSGITGHSVITAVVTNSSHSSSAIVGSSAVTGTLKSKSFIASNIHGIGSLFVSQYVSINNVEVTANPETPGTWVAAIIRITNIGNISMTWAASTDIYWLTAVLPSGVLPNHGDTVDIPIVVNMPGAFFPFPEPLTAHVTITANATGFPRVIEIDVAPIVRINTVGNEPGEWKSPIRFGLGSSLQW